MCYLPKPKAEADNTNRGLNNSSYPTRTEFNNCFIIYLYLYRTYVLYIYTCIYIGLRVNACTVNKNISLEKAFVFSRDVIMSYMCFQYTTKLRDNVV